MQAVGRLRAVCIRPDGDVFEGDVALRVGGRGVIVAGGEIFHLVAVFHIRVGIAAADQAVALVVVNDGAVEVAEVDQLEVVRDRLRIQVAGQLVAQLVALSVEGDAHRDLGVAALAAGEHQRAAEHAHGRQRDSDGFDELSAQCFDHIAS